MSYKVGIIKAIKDLHDRKGSSTVSIKKHMQGQMPSEKKWKNSVFLSALKAGVTNGELIQVKHSYKLSPDLKKSMQKKRAADGKPKKSAKNKVPKEKKEVKKEEPAKKATAPKEKAAPKKKATVKKNVSKAKTAPKNISMTKNMTKSDQNDESKNEPAVSNDNKKEKSVEENNTATAPKEKAKPKKKATQKKNISRAKKLPKNNAENDQKDAAKDEPALEIKETPVSQENEEKKSAVESGLSKEKGTADACDQPSPNKEEPARDAKKKD